MHRRRAASFLDILGNTGRQNPRTFAPESIARAHLFIQEDDFWRAGRGGCEEADGTEDTSERRRTRHGYCGKQK